jgi:hypothetical protein
MLQEEIQQKLLLWLIFLIPVFTYMNTRRKTAQEIDFVYLVNKEIYCIFKTCCVTLVLFSQKCHLFHNCILYLFK